MVHIKAQPKTMKPKDGQIVARLPEDEKEELNALAAELDIPVAQIVREGVRKQIAELKAKHSEKATTELAK